MEKFVKFIVTFVLSIFLYFVYFAFQASQLEKIGGFPLNEPKMNIWIYSFLGLLFLGSFILWIFFELKKKVKNKKIKKTLQITIYIFSFFWVCGFFYMRLDPFSFWNKDFHKTKTLVEIIHKELKSGKNFSTIYKENEKALKHFYWITDGINGNFYSTKHSFGSGRLAEMYDFMTPTLTIGVYEKRDQDDHNGNRGKKVAGDYSIFLEQDNVHCLFMPEKSNFSCSVTRY